MSRDANDPPAGFIAGFEFADGRRIARAGDADRDARPAWLLFDRRGAETIAWVRGQAWLDPLVVHALLAPSTRPRVTAYERGLYVNLRGVNLNEGADPEDMISLRCWVDGGGILAVQGPPLRSVNELIGQFEAGGGPRTPGGLLVALIDGLSLQMAAPIEALVEALDDLDERVIDPTIMVAPGELAALRRRAITLHRYLAPQVSALAQLHAAGKELFDEREHRRLKEYINRMTRFVEDLDAARSRGAVIADELANQLAAQSNQRVYVVTLIAAIFLPATLISGLLGMNVGGVPLAQHPLGFLGVTLGIAVLGLGFYGLARRAGWL